MYICTIRRCYLMAPTSSMDWSVKPSSRAIGVGWIAPGRPQPCNRPRQCLPKIHLVPVLFKKYHPDNSQWLEKLAAPRHAMGSGRKHHARDLCLTQKCSRERRKATSTIPHVCSRWRSASGRRPRALGNVLVKGGRSLVGRHIACQSLSIRLARVREELRGRHARRVPVAGPRSQTYKCAVSRGCICTRFD